jgi:hypothetical protein
MMRREPQPPPGRERLPDDAAWRCRENLRSFRGQLGRERSDVRRATLERLIEEEERKLQKLIDPRT